MATAKRSPQNRQLFEGGDELLGPSVERRIEFYEIEAGANDGFPCRFDPAPSLEHIGRLPFTIEGGRYLVGENKNLIGAIPISTEYPQKVIYYFSRRENLPEWEREGTFKPLVIPKDAGLGEKCHLMFFDRYVAAEFNFHGPRPTTFPHYLACKAKAFGPHFRLAPLLRGEATEELERLDGLVLARMKLSRSALGLVAKADKSLHQAVKAALASTGAEEVEIVLRSKKPTRKRPLVYLKDHVLTAFKRLASQSETYELFQKLEAQGVGSVSARREKVIDVLEDQLVATRRMIKTGIRSRAIDSGIAFQQIEAAFKEVLPRIAGASKVY